MRRTRTHGLLPAIVALVGTVILVGNLHLPALLNLPT